MPFPASTGSSTNCCLAWISRYILPPAKCDIACGIDICRCTAFDRISIPLAPQRISCGYTYRTPVVYRPFRQEWISINLTNNNLSECPISHKQQFLPCFSIPDVSQTNPFVFPWSTKCLSAGKGKIFSTIAKVFHIFLLTFSEKCV